MGAILAILTAVYAVYLAFVARYRQRVTAQRSAVMGILRYELLICACALLAALPCPWPLRLMGLALVIPALVLLGLILRHMGDVPAAPADTAVVLGMALEKGRPNRDLLHRVAAAANWAQGHPGAALVVTGGNRNGGLSEAEVMRDLLVERGVAPGRIILEDRAVDTPANFQNVARMIDPARPVVIITSGYHMLRASAIARDAGFTDVRRLSAKCDPVFLPANIAWEIVCEIDRLTQRMKKHRGGRT